MKRIYLVLPPQAHILDLGGPLQILGSLAELGMAPVEPRCVGPMPALKTFQGLALYNLGPLPGRLMRGDVVIVIGFKLARDLALTPAQHEVADWLRGVVAPRLGDVKVCSVCTGAFLLGAAGLLDGRDCTTHHDYLSALERRHPLARVLSHRMLVEDGPVLTSAGVTAGIDLALHLIFRHFGAAAAVRVARDNVVPFRRLARDPALDVQLRYRDHGHPLVHAVQDFLTEQPGRALATDDLARRFSLSYRHLARLFQQECGVSLKQYQQQLRLAMARTLLRDSDLAVEAVAERCGFASPQAFRAAWRQQEGIAPSRWRAMP